MTLQTLSNQIAHKRSCLCVGLDVPNPTFAYLKEVVDATAPYAVAYKPNVAFFEAQGSRGWQCLEETARYIKGRYPDCFLIADAKRGDIGNTAVQYAKAFFEQMDFDAITLAPYMGEDSVRPFLAYPNKYAIVLAITSNPSAQEFEMLTLEGGTHLYERVIETALKWEGSDRLLFVAGATRPEVIKQVKALAPNNFLLVPGVGAQGGTVEEVMQAVSAQEPRVMINVSRGVLQAKEGPAAAAASYAARFTPFLK